MSNFTKELIVKPIGDNRWELVEGFEYHVGTYPSDEVISVPTGFTTDFASVPRVFWNIISPVGNHGKAAVIHDYCYSTACYDKKRSDEIFLEAMEVLGVSKWKRNTMFYAVRWFGWKAWNDNRKKSK